MNIIVVDDEFASLNTFLANIVDVYEMNYSMFMNNPLASIDYVKQNHIDAAFLDIYMPEIDGVELAQELIAVSPDLSIVFISGYTQDEDVIRCKLGKNLLGFCYKPYSHDILLKYFNEIAAKINNSRKVEVRAFDGFDLYIEGKAVKFSSAKSKELFALLVDRRGATVTMGDALANLWADKDIELAKRLYRDAVFRLRMVLNDNNLGDLVEFGRAQLNLVTKCLTADSWEYIDGKNNDYKGQYMPSYDWSLDTQTYLDNLQLKRN